MRVQVNKNITRFELFQRVRLCYKHIYRDQHRMRSRNYVLKVDELSYTKIEQNMHQFIDKLTQVMYQGNEYI